MRHLLFVALASCVVGEPPASRPSNNNDDPPPKIKQPGSEQEDEGATSPGCDGVTETGTCRERNVVRCNVATDKLETIDCRAMNKDCIVDLDGGARCETYPTTGTGGDCGNGLTYEGLCNGETAIYCVDNTPTSWTCGNDLFACRTDCKEADGTPIPGAYCCGASEPPPPDPSECAEIGFAGICTATGVRWCEDNEIHEITCAAGFQCKVDVCATGADCCPI